MKILLILLFTFISTQFIIAQPPSDSDDPFETALALAGLTKSELTFDYRDMAGFGGDKFILPLFYTLHSSPFKLELHIKLLRDIHLQNCNSMKTLTSLSSLRLNEGVRRGLVSNPLEKILPLLESEEPLYEAIDEFERFYAVPMTSTRRDNLRRMAAEVPLELQKMASLIIYTSIDSMRYHQMAFKKSRDKYDLNEMYLKMADYMVDESENEFEIEPFIETIDFKYLYTPVQDIAIALDFVSDSLRKLIFDQKFKFKWDTYMGKIVINDGRDQKYDNDRYFLIIDSGGNDEYENAAATMDTRNHISILIDMGGDDTYKGNEETFPSFGAGLFGYGLLVDLAGNDRYEAKNLSQGIGICGVGILMDFGGSDSYDAYAFAQGSGFCGQGILSDIGGNDHYHMFQLGQGFGFTKGIGLLIDSTGNDIYIANDSIIDFPASQTKEHNSSLCQGVGFGKRADYVDGHSWAGGIGMLIDGHGIDSYSAGLFAQGCAYWYAIGVLSDVAGDDTYNGIWYVQGAGAHFGLGALLESEGNDIYNAGMNMAQGAGHDFTLGVLIDEYGNDLYNAPNLSLGGGNANGIGIFWDKQGDDTYNVSAATTLGRANVASRGGIRDHMLCLGLFLDTGGNDTYPQEEKYSFAKNNNLWRQYGTNTENPLDVEIGIGYDCEYIDSIK